MHPAPRRDSRALLFTCALLLTCLPAGALDLGGWAKRLKQGKEVRKVVASAAQAARPISPSEEYYIGRSVAATLLADCPPIEDDKAHRYINLLGQCLAEVSDRPETFKGYSFLLLDTDEINAFACPGGFILVTRGLVGLCGCEDDLAAVLAHEIAHVQLKHGLGAIKASRRKEMWAALADAAARRSDRQGLRAAARAFDSSIGDVVHALVANGYSRRQEADADATALTILGRSGHDPQGLIRILMALKQRQSRDRRGFFKTHPDPAWRQQHVGQRLRGTAPTPPPTQRTERFRAALGAFLPPAAAPGR